MSGYGGGPPPPPQGYPYNNNYPSQPTFPNNGSQPNLYPPPNQFNGNRMPTPSQYSNYSNSNTSASSSQTNLPSNSPPNNLSQMNIEISQQQAPVHYGEVPAVQQRRRQQQQVRLYNGHYVIESPVPTMLTSSLPKKENEFTNVRYTACTCDPDHFQRDRYNLRQVVNGRMNPEIFVVITMYNEDAKLFSRTFYGVVKNIQKLCNRDSSKSRFWGEKGWEKVVVCVVSDGRAQINKSTEDYLTAIGVYQKGLAKSKVNDKKVTAHIYEYTSQICIDPDMKDVSKDVEYTPIQVLFCLKEKNAKKINSHRWFFNAFGKVLDPNVCILLDAGTKPGGNSFYHLWKAFDTNSSIGGACGEIVAMKGKHGGLLFNPLVAAQNFEYKMSNILDKPLESVFGYITVLPGAFSAYRYIALLNNKDPESGKETGPLASYFLGEKHHQKPNKKKKEEEEGEEEEEEEIKTGLFEANMYLAEDRILCFELVSKVKGTWLLHYVKSAHAETDVPSDVVELIRQRRRWLNGSFFAGIYAISKTFNLFRSDHSAGRKFALLIEMIYQTINVAFSWFALGNIYLTFHILGSALATDEIAVDGLWSLKTGAIIFSILRYIYIGLIILQFSLALGNKPRSAKWAYIVSATFFSFLMLYMLFAAGWITYKGISGSDVDITGLDVNSLNSIIRDFTFRNIVLSLISTYGLYIIASLLFFEPGHMFHSIVQYMLLVPFYVNILNVYAFCNIHDVSWGTKGEPKAEELSTVKSDEKKEGTIEVELPDVDKEYQNVQDSLASLKNKSDKNKNEKKQYSEKELEELQQESNAMFRTYLVFTWMITNGILIGVVTSFSPSLDDPNTTNRRSGIYFTALLWCVAGLAAFRFFGSCTYLIFRLFNERIFDR